MVFADKEVEFIDLGPEYSSIAFLVSHNLLAVLHAVPDDRWNEDVDDGLELLEFLGTAVLCHKVDLAPEFVLIAVVDPE